MMTDVEQRFRESERELDKLLLCAKTALKKMAVEITDWSGRTYHYQNEKLSWNHWFTSKRPRGSEIEKATVRIIMDEDDPATLTVETKSEIFQIGKPSRWISSVEQVLPVGEACQLGLSKIVLRAIRWAEDAADLVERRMEA